MRVRKSKPCGESSPYQDWVDYKGAFLSKNPALRGHAEKLRVAIAKGDPDVLEAPESKVLDPQLVAILTVLNEGGEKVLTNKQRKAFQLVVREGLSIRKAARIMDIAPSVVVRHVIAGAKKLKILAMAH